MNKKELWNWIKDLFDKADEQELGTSWSWFGFKKNDELVELNYKEKGLTFDNLLLLLQELSNDGLLQLINTHNMGFIIVKK